METISAFNLHTIHIRGDDNTMFMKIVFVSMAIAGQANPSDGSGLQGEARNKFIAALWNSDAKEFKYTVEECLNLNRPCSIDNRLWREMMNIGLIKGLSPTDVKDLSLKAIERGSIFVRKYESNEVESQGFGKHTPLSKVVIYIQSENRKVNDTLIDTVKKNPDLNSVVKGFYSSKLDPFIKWRFDEPRVDMANIIIESKSLQKYSTDIVLISNKLNELKASLSKAKRTPDMLWQGVHDSSVDKGFSILQARIGDRLDIDDRLFDARRLTLFKLFMGKNLEESVNWPAGEFAILERDASQAIQELEDHLSRLKTAEAIRIFHKATSESPCP